MANKISLPNEWTARGYQSALWKSFTGPDPKKRACVVWPRRAGKDRTALALTSVFAMKKPATYWHMLPTNVQARRVVWDAVDRVTGMPLIDRVFPREIVKAKNDAEMSIELAGGGRWYAVGSDNYNRLVGSDPFGVIFSEWSLCDPGAWDYIRPILAENGGWAIFLYTPRGRNHGYSLYNMASSNPNWFCELLTSRETKHISQVDIDEEKAAGMPEEMIDQEFYCSFTAGAAGAYYGKLMEEARKEGRITSVPYDPSYGTEVWLDLGYDDATAVWVLQPRGLKLCAVRYQEFRTMSIPAMASEIKKWRYSLSLIRLPHDGEAHEQGTGRTKREMWEDALETPSETSPRPKNADALQEQINGVRTLLPTIWFDSQLCENGLFALESYCREWDSKTKRFMMTPKHDWSSHGADALRTGAARYVPGRYGGAAASPAGYRRRTRVIRAGQRLGPEPVDWGQV